MNYRTKFHRDGDVTIWNVFTQQWERRSARYLVEQCEHPFGNLILPTLRQEDRQRIVRVAKRG